MLQHVTSSQALGAVDVLRNFSSEHGDVEFQRALYIIEEKTQLIALQAKKQAAITDFFSKA